MKRKTIRRIIALILTFTMVTSLMHINSYAYYKGFNQETDVNDDIELTDGYSIEYEEKSSWNNFVNADIRVTNNTEYDKSLWSIAFIYDGVIESIWNADISEITDNNDGTYTYIISSKPYNSTIESKGFVSFGFIAYGIDEKPSEPVKLDIYQENNNDNTDIATSTDADLKATITDAQHDNDKDDNITDGRNYKIQDMWKGLEYALFTGDEAGQSFYVNNATINGSVHTNGSFFFQGNSIVLNGELEAKNGITLRTSDSEDSQLINSKKENADEIEMPDIYTEIHALMENEESYDKWDIYEGDKSFDSNELRLDKNIYVDGNISFNATSFDSNGIITAHNSITYNVGSVTTGEDNRIFIESEQGDITINGGNINLNAVLYAPNGKVTVNANEFHLNGRIIADEVCINGTLIEINAGNHDYDMISELEIFNTEIIKAYDTTDEFEGDEIHTFNNATTVEAAPYSLDNNISNNGIIISKNTDVYIEPISENYMFDNISVEENFSVEQISGDNEEKNTGIFSLSLTGEGDKSEYMSDDLIKNNNHIYMISSEKLTWKNAEKACNDMGGYLVVIDNAEENEFIKNYINGFGISTYTALGYTDEENEGRWLWVNGSDSTYTNWESGEPNDGLWLYPHQNYAFMYENGKWDDGIGDETDKGYFVCEWDNPDEVSFNASNKVIVKLTIEEDVEISDEFSDDNITIYNSDNGKKIIIWETELTGNNELEIPVEFYNASDELISDINVFYYSENSIKSERLSDIECSFEEYNASGEWTTVYDSGQSEAEWTYFDINALYEGDSDIKVYAYASDNLDEINSIEDENGLKEITLDEAMSVNGISDLKGRYVLIKAKLTKSSNDYTPYLDSITIGANTDKRPDEHNKEYKLIDIEGKDNLLINEKAAYRYKVITTEKNKADIVWETDGEKVSDENVINGRLIYDSEVEGNHTITVYYEDRPDICANKNITVGTSDGYINLDELIENEFTYPYFNMSLDKTSYVVNETIKVTTDISSGCSVEVLIDETAYDTDVNNGAFEVCATDSGEHTLKVISKNNSGNSFTRIIKYYVYEASPDINTWFDKETYYAGDDVRLYIEDGYIINSCLVDSIKTDYNLEDDGTGVLFEGIDAGLYTIKLNVTNQTDNEETDLNIYLFVNDAVVNIPGKDNEPPIAVITSVNDSSDNNKLEIIGTAKDEMNFSSYTLSYKYVDDEEYTDFAHDTKQVDNDVLGMLDKNGLESGVYDIRLTVEDDADNYTVFDTQITIAKETKEGYTISCALTDVSLDEDTHSINIRGSIDAEGHLKGYELLLESEGDEIKVISSGSDEVEEALLGSVQTEELDDGIYRIILKVEDESGIIIQCYAVFEYYKGQSIEADMTYSMGNSEVTEGNNDNDGDDTDKTDMTAPTAVIVSTHKNENTKDKIELIGTAKDETSLASYTLSYKAASSEEYTKFVYSIDSVEEGVLGIFDTTELASGEYNIRLEATDEAGNMSYYVVVLTVNKGGNSDDSGESGEDGGDSDDDIIPTALIISPSFDEPITAPVEITGSAYDETKLDNWRLEYKPADTEDYITIADGTEEVREGILGTLDPTMMINGIYELRLSVTDKGGNIAYAKTSFIVEGKLKIGQMHIGFNDITASMGGTKVSVNRIYDSRNKKQGDFGYGWNLDMQGIRLYESNPLSDGYEMLTEGSVFSRIYRMVETENHDIVVTYGDGTSDRFKIVIGNGISALTPVSEIYFSYRCVTNPKVTLEILTDTTAIYEDGQVVFINDGIYDLIEYKLTTEDGNEIYLNKESGVYKIVDSKGHTITIDENGYHSDDGRSISFTRDINGRIIKVESPDGEEILYTYDESGDLSSVTDNAGRTVTYTYDDKHNLVEIIDPTGKAVSRNEYDDEGRLIATIDADGNRMEYDHNVDGRREVITDRLGYKTVYTYDDDGNILSTTDANGNTTYKTYDDMGNVITSTDAKGNVTTSTYDDKGNLTSVTDAAGNSISIAYNDKNQAVRLTNINDDDIIINYDSAGSIISTTDVDGSTISYERDADGNVKSITDDIGKVITAEYDQNGNTISVTDAAGSKITYTYDERGNRLTETVKAVTDEGEVSRTTRYNYNDADELISVEDADGNLTVIERDGNGVMTAAVDSQGRRTEYTYDDLNNITRIAYCDGTSESFTYDAEGRLIKATDRTGCQESYAYDKVGNLTKITDIKGNETSYNYDENYNLTKVIYPTGAYVSYTYDCLNNNTGITTSDGNSTTFTYEAGLLSSATDSKGNVTSYEYNEKGDRTKVTYPDGTYESIELDSRGRCISATDTAGRKTEYTYDVADRLVSVKQNNGAETKYTYDKNGNLLSVTDANGNKTEYTYDADGRCIKTRLADGSESTYTYDDYGKLISTTDYNGVTTTYTYNNLDELTKVVKGTELVRFTYDDYGRVISISTGDSTVDYTYDEYGELISKTYENGQKVSYGYDEYGREISVTVSDDSDAEDSHILSSTSYEYDGFNRITRVIGHDGKATVYTYDANGNRETATFANGIVLTYTYDECNHLICEEVTDKNERLIARYQYEIEGGERTRAVESGPDGDITTVYSYDAAGRLISEKITKDGNTSEYKYTYDLVGNRLSKDVDGYKTLYTYNERNQLVTEETPEGRFTYSYDANGNLVSKSESVLNTDGLYGQGGITESYTYDSFNRMTGYTSGDISYSYTYDAEGVRRSKQNDNVQGSKITYISDTLCEYSQTLAELNSSDELCTSYTIGLEIISLTRGEEEYYYISDGHGDVRIITDEDGHIKTKYRYNGYGELIETSGDIENSHMYAGECYDEESGLYYLRARYMNPSTGTFTGMDSYAGNISDPDTLHKYLYANGNPVKYVDPSGNSYSMDEQLAALHISNELDMIATINIVGMISGIMSEMAYGIFGTEENKMLDSFLDGYCRAGALLCVTFLVAFLSGISVFYIFMVEEIVSGTKEMFEASYYWNTGSKGAAIYHFIWGLLHYIFAGQLHKADTKFRNSTEEARAAKEAEKAAEKAAETASEAVQEGGSGTGSIATPNSGQGFSPNGYNPQPGERTLNGYVKNNASPEVSLHTNSAGFNSNNGIVGGDFKRFGAESHGGVSPHVHQPQRNVAPNGNIYGTVGTKTANGGVTLPTKKDVKQLYEYIVNGKYH